MKVLLVDDHHLVRAGMRPLVEKLAPPGEAVEVFEAASFEEALATADAHPDLDIALLDLRLPDVAGFAALCDLQERHPGLPIVVVSGEDDPGLMREAIEHGALGFIPKSSSPDLILNALRVVLAGGTYLPREIMSAPAPVPAAPRAASVPAGLDLTPRQLDVLRLVIAGKSNKVICRELQLAEGTVKSHVAAVFRVLGVSSRVQAVLAASRLGIHA